MSGKNWDMFDTFLKVMSGNKKYIDLVLPKSYVSSIYEIDYKRLKQNGLTNLVFDIDNTLLPVNDTQVPDKVIDFINSLKTDFNICVVSNNKRSRVKPVAKVLDVPFISKANKPTKRSFKRMLKLLGSDASNTVMIGDQMLSDIKGANQFGLYSILVDPVAKKYDLKTGTSRVLQNIMTWKLGRRNIFKKNRHYK